MAVTAQVPYGYTGVNGRVGGRVVDARDMEGFDIGGADNKVPIQNLLDELRARGGGVGRLPRGVINVVGSPGGAVWAPALSIDESYSNITLEGEGPGATVLYDPTIRTGDPLNQFGQPADGDGNGILSISGGGGRVLENLTFRNLTLKNNSTNYNQWWAGGGLIYAAGEHLSQTSSTITVGAAAAHLEIAVPAAAEPGVAFNVTVTAKLASGATDTGFAGTVTLTCSDPLAVLPAPSALSSGVGTFPVTLGTSGNQTITATSGTQVQRSPAIPTGQAGNHFVVATPTTVAVGTPFTVTVTARDQLGRTDTGFTNTVALTSSDGAATLPAAVDFVNGVGVFSVTLNTAGPQTVTASGGYGFGINGLRCENVCFDSKNRTHLSLGCAIRGLWVTGCEFRGPGETGIYFAGDTRDAFVTGNRFLGSYYDLSAQAHIPVAPALSLRGTRDVQIVGNKLEGYTYSGLVTRTDSTVNTNLLISGNNFGAFPSGANPVVLGKTEGATVTDNIFEGHISAAVNVIYRSNDIVIARNTLKGAGQGIYVSATSGSRPARVSILFNQIRESIGCISCDDVDDYLEVIGNVMTRAVNDGSVGLSLYGTGTNIRCTLNRSTNYVNSIASQIPQDLCLFV